MKREVCDVLRHEARGAIPVAQLASIMSLGGGVAYRIASTDLQDVLARIADRFAPLLVRQDRNGWQLHITIQNYDTE